MSNSDDGGVAPMPTVRPSAPVGKRVPSMLLLAGAVEDLLRSQVDVLMREGRNEEATELYNDVRAALDMVWGRKGGS